MKLGREFEKAMRGKLMDNDTPQLHQPTHTQKRADVIAERLGHKLRFAVTQGVITADTYNSLAHDIQRLRDCVDHALGPTE